MPDTDTEQPSTRVRTPVPPNPTVLERVGHALSSITQQARRHALATRSWARRQPRARLATVAATTLASLALLGSVLWLLVTTIGWLSDGADSAPAPPVPSPPPAQLVAIENVGLWQHVWHGITGYAEQHAVAAGMPTWLLLTTWLVLGGLLLLGSWGRHRKAVCSVAFWAWLTATCWVIWTVTPGASPVPTALVAALGITASAVPISALPITGFVLIGVLA